MMGMLSCMRTGFGMSVCVIVLVVVLAVVLVWMELIVGVVVGVLAVVVVTMIVQVVLVDIDCVGVVSESSSGGFRVVVVMEEFLTGVVV